MDKIKVLWISDLVVPSGFGRVAHSILKYLPREDYEITGLGINYDGNPHKFDFPIYPCHTTKHPSDVYGFYRIQELCEKHTPDIIWLLNDAWVLQNYLRIIKEVYKDKILPKIVIYTPVDAKDHDATWYEDFDIVTKAVAYTKFGYKEILRSVPQLEEKLEFIGHGVDSDIFYQLPETKTEIKKKVYSNHPSFYDDSFIVFSGSRNQPRKRLDIAFKAFALFSRDKPENVKFYCHAGVQDAHIDLIKMASRLGMDNRLILTGLTTGIQRITEKRLNEIYNATDVGLNTATGEGWNLVSMEHGVTGAPQVLPDHSAHTELWGDCGFLVKPVTEVVHDGIMTTGLIVQPEDVAQKLQILYENRNILQEMSARTIQKFSRKEFTWEHIASQWDSLLKSLL